MKMNENTNKHACDVCLAHSYLITRLGAWIQNTVDDRVGPNAIDVIGLPSAELLAKVAPKMELAQLTFEIPAWDTVLEKVEVTAICQHDDLYPGWLLDAPAAPKVLFCRGNTDLLADQRGKDGMVSIVGARKATGYGLEVAATFGRTLAREGVTVVSGLALGIDGATHRGALETGNTIAVMACGPDRPYPASHSRLYRQIVERGLVISEQMPGADAWRWSFLARNRIIAGLSGSTVVAEAAWRSGSLQTANLAHEIGRDVYAVPGPITAGSAQGTNQLIVDGKAALVTDAAQVRAWRGEAPRNKDRR